MNFPRPLESRGQARAGSPHPDTRDAPVAETANATSAAATDSSSAYAAAREPVVRLTNVTRRFGEQLAVDGLDLQVQSGEVLALLGPNGAGKTTTVEMCEGFAQPDEGSVRIFGLDPYKHSDQVRSRLGVMLQGGGAYPGVRVGEMLDLVASYSQNPLDTDWLLETLGLASNRKTPYRRLSGGQQQRLSLACALVGRPELVFLDEPTAGLDAQSRMMVWELVRSLKRDGVAVVLTTHLMDEAEALADNVVIIDRGRVVAQGTPAQLTSQLGAVTATEAAPAETNGQAQVQPGSVRRGLMSVSVDRDVTIEEFEAEIRRALSRHYSDTSIAAGSLTDETTAEGETPGARRFDLETIAVSQPRPRVVQIAANTMTPELIAAVAVTCADLGVLIRSLDVGKHTLEDVFLSITGREIRS